MGLRIGDSARTLPTFQNVGPLQARQPVRPPQRTERIERPEPPSNQVRVGPLAPSSREEIVQAALREPVSSPTAAAVRALGTNIRAIREQQPTLQERSERVRERFEQAREQVFGPEDERAAVRETRQPEAVEPPERAQAIVEVVRDEPDIGRAARFEPPETPEPPEPVAPNPRILQNFTEPLPPSSVDLRG